ncbi:hypothetical protein CDAR_433241 [Caerostris darwini]|uniref:Uncharacterized protein n=1 Tax=Caerostris darwini TaxID=1538125 RepID=A0AAV4QMC4_9ARAC|nr:hypothetical protein CDAR_433241 [Caerostris darwini]
MKKAKKCLKKLRKYVAILACEKSRPPDIRTAAAHVRGIHCGQPNDESVQISLRDHVTSSAKAMARARPRSSGDLLTLTPSKKTGT